MLDGISAENDYQEYRLANIRNWIPAKVTSYNQEQRTADIELLVKIPNLDGEFTELPTITNVPFAEYSCKAFSFQIPIDVGDTVAAVFTNCGIDNWHETGELQYEFTESIGMMSNCFITPIFAINQAPNMENIISIDKDGNISIKMLSSIKSQVAENTIEINKDGEIEVTAQTSLTNTTGGSNLTLKDSEISINSNGIYAVNSTGEASINSDSSITIGANSNINVESMGAVKLSGAGTQILTNIADQLSQIGQLLLQFAGPIAPTPTGPQPLLIAAQITATATQLNVLSAQLSTAI